jgi:hypothetical protein
MRVALSLLLAAALTVPTPALAGNKGKKAHNVQPEQIHMSQATVAHITVTERTIIFDYEPNTGTLLPSRLETPNLCRQESQRKLRVEARCLQASPNGIFPMTCWCNYRHGRAANGLSSTMTSC